MGELQLSEFIALIQNVDGLVAGSTGPVHLAAAAGIHTLGLYPPRRGAAPSRWAPLGKKAEFLVHQRRIPYCYGCTKQEMGCACMNKISVTQVVQRIADWR